MTSRWDQNTGSGSGGIGSSSFPYSSLNNSSNSNNNSNNNSSTSIGIPNDSNSSSPGNLENFKKERRNLESEIDVKLGELSTLNDKVQREDYNDDSIEYSKIKFSSLISELDNAFKNLSRCNEMLVNDPNFSSNRVHKEKLEDYLNEYRKLKKNLVQTFESVELLYGGRSGGYGRKNDDTEIPMSNLLRENSNLQSSSYMQDSILGQARQVHEALENQRRLIRGAHGKVTNMPGLFHTIDGVTSKIKRFKQRNVMVLGLVIGLCICFLLYYSMIR